MKNILRLAMMAFLPLSLSAQAPVWVEQFETGNGSKISGGSFISDVNIEETGCGSVTVSDKVAGDNKPGATNPMILAFRNSCGEQLLFDLTGKLTVTARVRGRKDLSVRCRIQSKKPDGVTSSPKTEATVVPITRVKLLEDNVWQEISFNLNANGTKEASPLFNPAEADAVWFDFQDGGSSTGLSSTFEIDWIAIGGVPSGLKTYQCGGSPLASTSLYSEGFSDGATGFSGEGLSFVNVDYTTNVGSVTLTNGATLLDKFKPLILNFKGIPESDTVLKSDGKIAIQVTLKPIGTSMTLRVDAKSHKSENSTNECAALNVSRRQLTFEKDVFTTHTFDFSSGIFKDDTGKEVDLTELRGLNVFFLSGLEGSNTDSFEGDGLNDGVVIDEIKIVKLGSVGVLEKTEKSTLNFYPNPVSENLNFTATSNGKVSVANSTGIEVISQTTVEGVNSISTSSLYKGMYIINVIESNGKISSSTFVKE